jgi:hypothetical protein
MEKLTVVIEKQELTLYHDAHFCMFGYTTIGKKWTQLKYITGTTTEKRGEKCDLDSRGYLTD